MKVVIIGYGIAAHTLASALLKGDDSINISIFSAEAQAPLQRPRVLSLLGGGDASSLRLPSLSDTRLTIHNGTARCIDRAAKSVLCSDGSSVSYDILVLACGAKAASLALPGGKASGVFTVRSVDDVMALRHWLDGKGAAGPCAVIGGGLLGLEAAALTADYAGHPVTVVETAPWLLPRQLDEGSAGYLKQRLHGLGVNVVCGVKTSNFLSKDGDVSAIKCDDGFTIPASTIIESVGIRPDTFLAVDAGLEVKRGVVVDDRMRTSDEDIFAIGDVAEWHGQVPGTAAVAMEMARTLSRVILDGDASYKAPMPSSILKVAGLDVITTGDATARHEACHVVEGDGYREAWFTDVGILSASVLIGSRAHASLARSGLGKVFDPASLS